MDFSKLKWPWSWHIVGEDGQIFLNELRKELCEKHALYRVEVSPVARCGANDDVLFEVLDSQKPPLVVVHLTWVGHVESDPLYPSFHFCKSIEQFLQDYWEEGEEDDDEWEDENEKG